ncbi:MAG TPA: MBL fold metallo-hydrolase [Thermoanaerobaculia bacterium]|nr:MBL fold metallo-hydrolase [Thermoanaerobaculia bacterium]
MPAGDLAGPVPPPVELLYAPHREAGRYFNPWLRVPVRFTDLLRWKLGHNPYDKSAPPRVPVAANDGSYLRAAGQPASLTWVGHSTFAIQDGGEVVLTDPHWGTRALLPRRKVPPGIPLAAVPETAFAVLSHNHYDHLDTWTVAHLPESVAWVVPKGLATWFRGRRCLEPVEPREPGEPGEPRERREPGEIIELDWWQSVRRGRWTLTCLPAQHWSNRLDSGRNTSLWCSWLLDSGNRRYYFAGDTGYFHGFAEFGRRYGPIDVALLPIGAYEPRWFMRPQHMNPEEAFRAYRDLGARILVAMHWGVFDLTDEPVDLAPRVLESVLKREHARPGEVRILAIGERYVTGLA